MPEPETANGLFKLGELGMLFGVLLAWVAWELWTVRRRPSDKADRR